MTFETLKYNFLTLWDNIWFTNVPSKINDIFILDQTDLFWKRILFFTIITVVLCNLLFFISYFLSFKIVKDVEKLSEYECGFEPFDHATRQPFDVHFFIVGILFLVFDVEIALIFPWVLGLNMFGWFGFFVMMVFLIVITVGFIYEWHIGALQWPIKNFILIILPQTENTLQFSATMEVIVKFIRSVNDLVSTMDVSSVINNSLPFVILFLSLFMVLVKNPMHALLSLIGVFFLIALILISLKAEFLAMLFLIIYIGAISILFLFVIMMFNLHKLEVTFVPRPYFYSWYFYIFFLLPKFYFMLATEMSRFFYYIADNSLELTELVNNFDFNEKIHNNQIDNTHFFTQNLNFLNQDIFEFSKYFYTNESLLFLLLAYILLTAMVGAITLALSLVTPESDNTTNGNKIMLQNWTLPISLFVISDFVSWCNINDMINTWFKQFLNFFIFWPEMLLGCSSLMLFLTVAKLRFKPLGSFANQKIVSNELFIWAAAYILLSLFLNLSTLITFGQSWTNNGLYNADITVYYSNNYLRSDLFFQTIKAFVTFTTLLIMLSATSYVWMHKLILAEYGIFFILFLFFLYCLVGANNLIAVVINIIGFSLTIYIFILFDKFNFVAIEAGSKYFVLSTLSTGFVAGGVVIAYQMHLTLNFNMISVQNWNLTNINWEINSNFKWLFCIAVIIGLLFKIGAAPGHLWLANVYNGSSNPTVALFAVSVKIITFTIFVVIVSRVLHSDYLIWSFLIWFSSLVSMLWGGLGALNANKVKAFIAYSSVNQMGFMLIGVACKTAISIVISFVYLFIYILMQLVFMYIFITTTKKWFNMKSRSVVFLTDFAHVLKENMVSGIVLVLILFSMAGIPPLPGFFSKYFVFYGAFQSHYYSLIIIGMTISLVSALYYLAIVTHLSFNIRNKSLKN